MEVPSSEGPRVQILHISGFHSELYMALDVVVIFELIVGLSPTLLKIVTLITLLSFLVDQHVNACTTDE